MQVFVTRNRLHLVSQLTHVLSVNTNTPRRPAQGTKLFGPRAVIDQLWSNEELPFERRKHLVTLRLVVFITGLIDVIT